MEFGGEKNKTHFQFNSIQFNSILLKPICSKTAELYGVFEI